MIIKEYQINEPVNCGAAQIATGARFCVEQVVYDNDKLILLVNTYKDGTHTETAEQTDISQGDFSGDVGSIATAAPQADAKAIMDSVLQGQYTPANVVEIV